MTTLKLHVIKSNLCCALKWYLLSVAFSKTLVSILHLRWIYIYEHKSLKITSSPMGPKAQWVVDLQIKDANIFLGEEFRNFLLNVLLLTSFLILLRTLLYIVIYLTGPEVFIFNFAGGTGILCLGRKLVYCCSFGNKFMYLYTQSLLIFRCMYIDGRARIEIISLCLLLLALLQVTSSRH